MKPKTKKNLAWLVSMAAAISGAVYILTPTIIVDGQTPYDRRLMTAIEDFHAATGRYPEFLTDAQPYLRNGRIIHLQNDDYQVEVDHQSGRIYVLEVKYSRNPGGTAQDWPTKLVSTRRK